METFDSTKNHLYQILKDVHNGKIQLPDFQRGWIWDDNRIKGLIASIAKSFPIGAIMLLETGNENVRFKTRPIEGIAHLDGEKPEKLILDGQQRITSLYQSIIANQCVLTRDDKGKEIKRWYYIDMQMALDEDEDIEDAILSINEEKKITTGFGREIVLDLSTPEKEFENLYYPVHLIDEYHDWRSKFNRYWNYEPEKAKFWDKFEINIINNFNNYMLPVILMKKENQKEAICQVFEKVNTGGVSLNVFELLTATFAADDFDLRQRWNDIQEDFSDYKLLDNVQNDDFLQAISLFTSYAKRKEAINLNPQNEKLPAVTCKRKDILKLKLEDYKKYEGATIRGFKSAAKLLHTQYLFSSRDIPYRTQLVPLAVGIELLGDKIYIDTIRNKVIRWYWCGVLGELYGSAVETRFALDIQDLVKWSESENEPRTVKDANFIPDRLKTLRSRNSAAYKGIYALLLRYGVLDFRSGESVNAQTYFDEAIDIHHIFPKKWCEENKFNYDLYDSIINKTPVSYKTNRKIGGDAPSIYLKKIKNESAMTDSRMEEILRTHLISHELMMADDFKSFYLARNKELMKVIENAMGKELDKLDGSTTEDIFGYA